MVGQWTMSGPIEGLTCQTLVLPVILAGHFWMRTFYNIFHIVVTYAFCSITLLLCTKPFKEKERRNKFPVVMKCNKAKQQQTELWSNATMQQVGTVRSALL